MTNKEQLDTFIENNSTEILSDYRNKIYENIQVINLKEEKHTLWLLIILLFYLFLNTSTISSLSIGPFTLNNSLIFSEVIPIVFIGITFNLNSIGRHREDLNQVFQIVSSSISNNFIFDNKKQNENYLYRMYLPFSTANFVYYILNNKPNRKHLVTTIILLSPIIILAFIPYFLTCYMIYDLWTNHFQDLLGKISFFITLWIFLILLFITFLGRERTL